MFFVCLFFNHDIAHLLKKNSELQVQKAYVHDTYFDYIFIHITTPQLNNSIFKGVLVAPSILHLRKKINIYNPQNHMWQFILSF